SGEVLFGQKPTPIHQIPIPQEIFDTVRQGLYEVVNSPRGTAKRAALAEVGVAGKTGTAQAVRLNITGRKAKPEDLPREYRDHGWFVAFAPFENPKIAVAILGEHVGKAGSSFAPIARELIALYLGIPIQPSPAVASAPRPAQPAPPADAAAIERFLANED
ncbi:MAG: penicillin-binding transpeptidase domain-containing protein, partial [Nitrospinota bacterium]